MSTHSHAEQEAPRRPSMLDAASGIFDRMGRFTAEQRAEVFFHMENRWCWTCGEQYEWCRCGDAEPPREWPRLDGPHAWVPIACGGLIGLAIYVLVTFMLAIR